LAISFDTISNFFSASALGKIAGNFSRVADELDKVVYANGSRVMTSDLDLNSNRVINAAPATVDNQLATLGQVRTVAATISKGAKGDPGSSLGDIGLFTQASAISVPSGVNVVTTSGNRALGAGRASYIRSASGGTSLTSFLDAAGNRFKLDLNSGVIPKPSDVGALGITNAANLATDDLTYLQGLIDAMHGGGSILPGLPGGGVIQLDANRSYYINGTLDLGKWITLRGHYERDEILGHDATTNNNPDKSTIALGAFGSTLILGKSGKILRGDHSGTDRVSIISAAVANFMNSPSADMTVATVQTLLDSYKNYPLAIDSKEGACGTFVDNCLIVGFNLAIKQVYNERWRVSWTKIDCINGFYATRTYDDSRFFANHIWPFGWSHRLPASATNQVDLLANYGTAVNFDPSTDPDRSIDGGHVFCNLIYGYLIAIKLNATNGLHCHDNWIDGNVAQKNTANTVGIQTVGNCRRTKILNNHVDSQGRCLDMLGAGWIIDDNTTAGATVSHLRLGAGAIGQVGNHWVQGGSPLYIEVVEGCGQVTFSNLYASIPNGPLIALLGGGLPSAATRSNIRLGAVTIDDPQAGFFYDARQWRSWVQAQSVVDQTLSPGTYAKVIMTTVSNGSSPIDGYGEFASNNGTFTARRAGFYRFDCAVFFNAPSGTVVGAQARIDGIAQDVSQDQILVDSTSSVVLRPSCTLYLNKGQTVDLWAYSSTNGSTLPSGKAAMNISRISDS
jgi:hypothetical protein